MVRIRTFCVLNWALYFNIIIDNTICLKNMHLINNCCLLLMLAVRSWLVQVCFFLIVLHLSRPDRQFPATPWIYSFGIIYIYSLLLSIFYCRPKDFRDTAPTLSKYCKIPTSIEHNITKELHRCIGEAFSEIGLTEKIKELDEMSKGDSSTDTKSQ